MVASMVMLPVNLSSLGPGVRKSMGLVGKAVPTEGRLVALSLEVEYLLGCRYEP